MNCLRKIILYDVFFLIFSTSCTWDHAKPDYKGYPEEIGKIIITNCITIGCHNDVSKDAAGGLSITSWEELFNGDGENASVIPYSPGHSFLFFSVNTYNDVGPSSAPTMPYNQSPLTHEQVIIIKNWIAAGAPDANGFVKFSDNAERRKFYVANQGCDLVGVFDIQSKLIMRYINVGNKSSVESPHMIRVSPDGQFWYVIFLAGNVIQKFRTDDDSYVGEAVIGFGSWNTFSISENSKYAYIVSLQADGAIAYVDIENLTLLQKYEGAGLLSWPHGSYLNKTMNTLYVTSQYGNFVYKINVANPDDPQFEQIVLEPAQPPVTVSKLDPHEILFNETETRYFVTCQKTNEVRVFDAISDSLIANIPVGNLPSEMSLSKNYPYLFVSCMEDTTIVTGGRGSVAVIDYQNLSLVTTVYTGFQPHGLTVDDKEGLVYVANRNISASGPTPHHTTVCGGRNGYVTIINIATLKLLEKYNAEASVDPYSIAIRD